MVGWPGRYTLPPLTLMTVPALTVPPHFKCALNHTFLPAGIGVPLKLELIMLVHELGLTPPPPIIPVYPPPPLILCFVHENKVIERTDARIIENVKLFFIKEILRFKITDQLKNENSIKNELFLMVRVEICERE